MPISKHLTRFILVSFYLFILLQLNNLFNGRISHQQSSEKDDYSAIPLLSYHTLKHRPRKFKKIALFELSLFENVLVEYMAPWVEMPRNFYLVNGNFYDCPIDFNDYPNRRSTALSTEDRILRFILMLRGVKSYIIEEMFDQDYSVAYRDFIHCCRACMHGLAPIYLKPLEPGSDEWNDLVGSNSFSNFPNVSYAADVTKVWFRIYSFFFFLIFCVFMVVQHFCFLLCCVCCTVLRIDPNLSTDS